VRLINDSGHRKMGVEGLLAPLTELCSDEVMIRDAVRGRRVAVDASFLLHNLVCRDDVALSVMQGDMVPLLKLFEGLLAQLCRWRTELSADFIVVFDSSARNPFKSANAERSRSRDAALRRWKEGEETIKNAREAFGISQWTLVGAISMCRFKGQMYIQSPSEAEHQIISLVWDNRQLCKQCLSCLTQFYT
jgi:5'-3' exonuclease